MSNIPKELLLSHQPEGIKDRYEKPIGVLTDGTVVTIDTPRKSSLQQRATYNNKMHTNGVLGIMWTSACGMLLHCQFLTACMVALSVFNRFSCRFRTSR